MTKKVKEMKDIQYAQELLDTPGFIKTQKNGCPNPYFVYCTLFLA